jgi:tryptophanyl-tRNA synthetase
MKPTPNASGPESAAKPVARKRVLSGMRPTNRLHVGNFVGALANWVPMQNDHECFFAIVDWHALTTDYSSTKDLHDYTFEMALDYLGAGLDPSKSTIFVQSDVKEHAELHLLLSMIVPLGWLYRVPTYKEQLRELSGKDLETYGFLGYPVLQAADILAYRAELVPVGEDQVAHLELTREIVRRFNSLYGQVFPEPEARLTRVPRLPGLDGRKMSKSYSNAIFLSDDLSEARGRIATMVTDPARRRRTDPGNPELCPVYPFHEVFSATDQIAWAEEGCRTAAIGCLDCKRVMADNLSARLEPIQARRADYAARPNTVREILADGALRARKAAGETLRLVREAMGLA